jgi:hypothetical protein
MKSGIHPEFTLTGDNKTLDADTKLQLETQPSSTVKENLNKSRSEVRLPSRFSINQVRLERLEHYNKQSQFEINRVPQLLQTMDQRFQKANMNKELY